MKALGRLRDAPVALLFVVSGATALIGEVVWMRMLGLVLGNTVWAASTAVAAWMGGMALGAAVGGWLAGRTRHQLWWYGAAEGGVGVFYTLSPAIHSWLLIAAAGLGDDLGGHLGAGIGRRLMLAALVLLPPTALMGMTLPLLVERVRGSWLASKVGLLYGVNTIGAAGGVFLAAYWLLPRLGERGSLAAAAVSCLVVAAGAWLLDLGTAPSPPRRRPAPAVAGGSRGYLMLVALMGGAALAAELIWVRILVLHLGSRVYAFALLLGVYLVGLALGSLAVRVLPVAWRPRPLLAAVQLVAALALCAQLAALGHFTDLMMWLAATWHPPASFAGLQLVELVAVAMLFLPVTVAFGASFPLAVAADPAPRTHGAHAARIATANTIGAIAGALAAPFVLIPAVGSQHGLLLLAVVHAAIAALLVRRGWLMALPLAVVVASGVLWLTVPADWVLRRVGNLTVGRGELLELDEGIGATLTVTRYPGPGGPQRVLELNGVNVAGTARELRIVQQLQGNLPLLQVAAPRRVLHVGFGSGGTCWAVSRHPVESITVVEIAPEVPAAAARWFPEINRGVLDDPRVRLVVNDGRNFLLATEQRFDAILSDSIHPLFAGNSTLYTRDYFELCRRRLAPGGVVSMWLPLYSLDRASLLRILRAFWEVFPRTALWYDITTVNENTIVTGMVTPGALAIAWPRLGDAGVAASLAEGGVHSPADLMSDLLLGPAEIARLVAEVPPLRDDLPFVEYTSGRLMERNRPWFDNLVMLAEHRATESPFAAAPAEWSAAASRRDRDLRARLDALWESLTATGRAAGDSSGTTE